MRNTPVVLAFVIVSSFPAVATAARISYHGDLMDGDTPADGAYDLRLRSFAAPNASVALGEAVELTGVTVKDGRFVLDVDLPEGPIGATFVEVAVRKTGTRSTFETLGTPQAVTAVNTGCWALDGNTGLAAGSFLGIADTDSIRDTQDFESERAASKRSEPGRLIA
jgi:hypothetical protein